MECISRVLMKECAKKGIEEIYSVQGFMSRIIKKDFFNSAQRFSNRLVVG